MANASNWSPLVNSPLWRFTLRQLFIWTAFVAVACVALRNASATWASSMLGLALLILAASLLLAMFREGRQRAYWIGFATVGWLYMILLGYSNGVATGGRRANPFKEDALVTTQLSRILYTWMCEKIAQPPAPAMAGGYGSMSGGYAGGGMESAGMMPGDIGYGGSDSGMGSSDGSGYSWMGAGGPAAPTTFIPAQHDFTNVAHALWTLLLAACGGGLATWLQATPPPPKENTSDHADRRGSSSQ